MPRLPRRINGVLYTALLAILVGGQTQMSGQTPDRVYWQDVQEGLVPASGVRHIVPTQYRTLRLDLEALRSLLTLAPREEFQRVRESQFIISLPLPDGSFGRFRVVESPIMAPELAAKFPGIRTYLAQGIDDPAASTRFDITLAGFHGMIFSAKGTVYIDPFASGTTGYYQCYYKRDLPWDESRAFVEEDPVIDDQRVVDDIRKLVADGFMPVIGEQLRTYRAAVAATGEYTAFHGGTVPLGMSAIVTAMNRVSGIYEREVAVRMVLVANNNLIVYTNSGTDPYTNGSGSTMLGQNQTNLDAVIGSANYDIGHVFSTGGGGIAGLAVICRAGNKARGVTGQPAPIGDPFYVDYVAHEMGHQFGGNHTFNGNAGSCAGNRNASTAYEPGSASTIMGYAGICDAQDLQPNSDDYFHGISIDEMVAYTTVGLGNGCPVTTSTGNAAPVVNAGVSGLTIPISTPFALTGSASDPGDALTYCWEEFDLGAAGAPNSPSGNAPIFRSFDPAVSPQRIFPKLSDLLNNTQTIGEILPTYGRTLAFRLTARDNRAGGGGVGQASVSFTVSAGAGPFLVTSPNTAVSWIGAGTYPITWNVANTSASPVNCANVKLLLSTDGGLTWGYTLAASTANDGSESVVLPNITTTTARVKVEAVGNIFFDISNTNFSITQQQTITTISPNGGEAWQIGTLQSIQWSSLSVTGNVKVELTRNGGTSYETLFASINNDGSESWTVTSPVATSARVKISSVSNPAVVDSSNGLFTVSPNFTLLTKMMIADGGGDGMSSSDSLDFGTGEGATDGIDPLFGEYELPPLPPSGVFDVRWKLTGTQGMRRDIRDTLGGTHVQEMYIGLLQPGEAGYPFVLRWNGASLSTGTFIIRDQFGGSVFLVNMKQQDSVVISDMKVTQFQIIYDAGNIVSSNAQNGWNIVSLPVTVADRQKAAVFPTSTSSAFAYTSTGYVNRDTLDYGLGYWLKFPSAQVLSVTGAAITTDTIDVVAGWNIIGSISSPVSTGSIVQIPGGIVASPYFSYGVGGYGSATTIDPMKGYWVKASQNGKLVLTGGAAVSAGKTSDH